MNRRIGIALALGLLGAATACGGSDTSATRSATPTGAFAKVNSVRPGLLVSQEKPFTAAQVRAIGDLRGVSAVALIGYKQLSMYDRLLATAAVDPTSFRQFTYPDTANSEALWRSVHDGSGLISHAVGTRDRLPLAARMPVGWGTVEFSGLATTVPGIDLLVSVKTGRELGVPFGNAAVIATTGDQRQVRERLAERLGGAALIRPIVTASATPPGGSILPELTPSASSTPTSTPTRTRAPAR